MQRFIVPHYEKAIQQANRKKIIKAIAEAGGISKFTSISNTTGIKDNVLLHHLNALIDYGIIEQDVAGGPYSLIYKTPLCFIFGQKMDKTTIAYVGLLGERNGRSESETQVALSLLKRENIECNVVCIVTSSKAASTWENMKEPTQWILCENKEVDDIDSIRNKIERVLVQLLKDTLVIMDCTSFNKPATIAMYEIAQTYLVPLIYVYEPTKKLKWLISKEKLVQRFKI